jgi:hypothetical protein
MASTDLSAFATARGGSNYPAKDLLIFGSDYGHSEFVTPMARFQFYNAFGEAIPGKAPIVFIRMGGTFQTALSNRYSETQSIFGSPDSTVSGSDIGTNLATVAKGGLDSVYKQLVGAGGAAIGFLGSAGLSGKAQYEFMTRRVLNTFQQLIYNGPVFRSFQLPFTMKPTSQAEAEIMINIIKTFQIASSPKGDKTGGETIKGNNSGVTEKAKPKEGEEPAADPKVVLSDTDIRLLTGGDPNVIGGGTQGSNFSFGYPDICQFQILLKKTTGTAESTDGSYVSMGEIFQSGYCVIENVAIDYGGQNKMVFFTNTNATGGKYYPSEVTLTISLRETTLPTADFMSANHNEAGNSRTIF